MTERGERVLLVVGGGIAAFKSVIVARELMRLGLGVETLMTAAATRFVTPLTFAGVTGQAPHTELWDERYAGERHIELSARCARCVIAPATANLMARLAGGLADDLATATLLAFEGPVLLAPAMHPRMWNHPATVANVAALGARGARFIGPEVGPLASGDSGIGRMSDPEVIARATLDLGAPRDLLGRTILITAGPTYEPIDPVRFIGNRSSGRMGYAIASRALARGAKVELVTGPTRLAPPSGCGVHDVRTAIEMRDAVMRLAPHADAAIMSAAVADFRAADVAPQKLKKDAAQPRIELVRNPDILAELGASRRGARPVLVGFALETERLVEFAREKLSRKRCDLIVANLAEDGFEGADNLATLVSAEAEIALPRMQKSALADRILDEVVARLPGFGATGHAS